jgi:hypothetical protein
MNSRWRSDTLWVTLIRLWLHWLSCYCQIVVVEISLQFYRYPVQTSLGERVNQQSFDTPLNCNQFLHFLCKHCLAWSHTIFKFQVFARTRYRSEHSPADPWRHICPKRHHCAIAQLHSEWYSFYVPHFCFIPFSVQMYIQQFLFGPPAAGAVEGLFGFRTWHLKIWVVECLGLAMFWSLDINCPGVLETCAIEVPTNLWWPNHFYFGFSIHISWSPWQPILVSTTLNADYF